MSVILNSENNRDFNPVIYKLVDENKNKRMTVFWAGWTLGLLCGMIIFCLIGEIRYLNL